MTGRTSGPQKPVLLSPKDSPRNMRRTTTYGNQLTQAHLENLKQRQWRYSAFAKHINLLGGIPEYNSGYR